MTFNSLEFLIFFPITLLVYFLLPKKIRWIGLLIASYVFYLYFNIWLVFLIIGTTLISYLAGLLIEKYNDRIKVKKACLIIALVVCIGTLFLFKYLNFALDLGISLMNLFGGNVDKVVLNIILPVGISFYTFQTLSYVIDVYRGTIKPEKHLGYYALFVVYFPQLVAGPIERPENLIPQLKNPSNLTKENLVEGLRIMLIGFIKKVVIADGVSTVVTNVFNDVSNSSAIAIIIATLLFTLQIYGDFAGYTDIAIGCAKIMGIKLSKNFDHPYRATSIGEFWRRWHISLSSWFRDYVYIPLGGSRCSFAKWSVNILVVFLLSGLWHGASLTFVLWGVMHGVFQVIEKGYATLKEKYFPTFGSKINPTFVTWLKRIKTFLLVAFAWMFFRANSISDAFEAVKVLFTAWDVPFKTVLLSNGLSADLIVKFILFVPLIIVLDLIRDKEDIKIGEKNEWVNYAFYLAAILLIAIAWVGLKANGVESTFIYFQF